MPLTEIPFKPHGWWKRVWQSLLISMGSIMLAIGWAKQRPKKALFIFGGIAIGAAIAIWWAWSG